MICFASCPQFRTNADSNVRPCSRFGNGSTPAVTSFVRNLCPNPLAPLRSKEITSRSISGLMDGPSRKETATSRSLLFPSVLRRVLDDAVAENNQHIISWVSNGRAFKVHDPEQFTNKILKRYFRQTRFKSFTRQLYHYGFGKVDAGADRGSFFHPKFSRDDYESCISLNKKTAREHVSTIQNRGMQALGSDFDDFPDDSVYPSPVAFQRHPAAEPFWRFNALSPILREDAERGSQYHVRAGEHVATPIDPVPSTALREVVQNDWFSSLERHLLPLQFSSSSHAPTYSSNNETLEPRRLEEMMDSPSIHYCTKHWRS